MWKRNLNKTSMVEGIGRREGLPISRGREQRRNISTFSQHEGDRGVGQQG
jgi:hypothetical protein